MMPVSPATRKAHPWLVVTATAATLALCYLVWRRLIPLGIPGEWVWPYGPLPEPRRLIVAVLCCGCAAYLGFGVWRSMRGGKCGAGLVLAALLGTGLLARVGIAALTPNWALESAQVVLSDVATSYYGEAVRLEDVREYVRDYPRLMRSLPYHLQTHPPGAVLTMWLVRRATDEFPGATRGVAARLLGPLEPLATSLGQVMHRPDLTVGDVAGALWVLLFLAAAGWLTSLAVYGIASRLFDEETALLAGVLCGLVPSVLVFMATIDQLVMLLGALALLCVVWAMQRGGGEALLVPGLVVGVGALVTFGILTTAGVAALVVVLWRVWWGPPRWWAVVDLLCLAAGTLLPSVAMYALMGYDPVTVFRLATQAHHEVVTELWKRSYSHWVVGNLVDFGVMLGLPLSVLALSAARAKWRGEREDTLTAPAVAVAFGVVLAALDLSGTARAEVARIWLFLTPVPVVLAGRALAVQGERRVWAVGLLLGCQALQAIVMGSAGRFLMPY